MDIYIQVNDETLPNFINSIPQIGTYEKYESYPNDRFVLLNKSLFNTCEIKENTFIIEGLINITQFYYLENKNNNYILTRYDYSTMNEHDKILFNNSMELNYIFLSVDYYKIFKMSEDEIFDSTMNLYSSMYINKLTNNLGQLNFTDIVKYCDNQTSSIRYAAQNILNTKTVNINLLHISEYINKTKNVAFDDDEIDEIFEYIDDFKNELNSYINEMDQILSSNNININNQFMLENFEVPTGANLDINFNDNKNTISKKLTTLKDTIKSGNMSKKEIKNHLNYLGLNYYAEDNKNKLTEIFLNVIDQKIESLNKIKNDFNF